MLNTFIASYTFEGNTMRYEGINKMIGKPLIVEWYFFYNENTIVLFSQKEFINGEEVEMFSNNHYFVWYYTLNGNELKIERGKPFENIAALAATKGLKWVNNGTFKKTE